MEARCPCCDQRVASADVLIWREAGIVCRNGVTIHLSPIQTIYFEALRRAWPGVALNEKIYNAAHGDSLDPPAPAVVKVVISHLRRKLRELNLSIIVRWGVGYQLDLTDAATAEAIEGAALRDHLRSYRWTEGDNIVLGQLWINGWRRVTDIAAAMPSHPPYSAIQRAIERLALDLERAA